MSSVTGNLCNKCPKQLVKQNCSYSDYFNAISGFTSNSRAPGGPVTVCHLKDQSFIGLLYVSLQLHMQNQRKKWNFLLNFQTMCKLSERYSRIFQTQSSGCASGVDHFRSFTKLKILNIWIVKYLLNCKRYLSYNFQIFQKISECWVLENLDVYLEWTTSELEFKSEKSKIVTFSLEFNGQVLVRQD